MFITSQFNYMYVFPSCGKFYYVLHCICYFYFVCVKSLLNKYPNNLSTVSGYLYKHCGRKSLVIYINIVVESLWLFI